MGFPKVMPADAAPVFEVSTVTPSKTEKYDATGKPDLAENGGRYSLISGLVIAENNE